MATSRPVQSVNNTELYNRWANVYDTDGNILQAIDDALIPSLLTQAFSLLASAIASPITITELGAGTGRNTVKLLDPALSSPLEIQAINALDLSPGMLEIARSRCQQALASSASSSPSSPTMNFHVFDALHPPATIQQLEGTADLVLSTLVLEHLPLDVFFRMVKRLLKGNGVLLLTNMHAEMGRMSQAGFVDEETGEKVRGSSFVYEVADVVDEAHKWGFVLLGDMGERGVTDDDLFAGNGQNGERKGLLGSRGRKWVGVKVWFGCVMRLG